MRLLLLAVVAAPFLTGCSSGPVSEAPPATYDPDGIAQAVLSSFDKNKNGLIEGAELDACPALKSALPAIDKNRDKRLSAGEIRQRVEQYAARGTVSVTCAVTLDGEPLAGAAVTLEPEKCMGPSLKTATTTTDPEGTSATFQVDGQSVTRLPPGLYRIRVTKDGINLPARYNTQTTLGREVFMDPRQGETTIELPLTSR